MSLDSFFTDLPQKSIADVWRSAKKGLKYAFFLFFVGGLYHIIQWKLFGHTHPGIFDELYWTSWGTLWGVFFYTLNHNNGT